MQYRRLGRWGVRVSTIGLGSWLLHAGADARDTLRRCIRRAHDLGVNLFDTADSYSDGQVEEVVGQALSSVGRDSFVLATKAYFPTGGGANSKGLSRKHLREVLHESLRRLRTEYIDLYQCHRFDFDTPVEETCRTFDDFVRQGKILYWGVSEWTGEQVRAVSELCQKEGWSPPVSNQVQYSALWRRIEKHILPACRDVGMGVLAWSPLAMGVLTGKYKTLDDIPPNSRRTTEEGSREMRRYLRSEVLDAVHRLKGVASDSGFSLAEMALAWCLREPAVSSVIVGATREAHVDENVRGGEVELTPAIIREIDEILSPVSYTGEDDPWLRT